MNQNLALLNLKDPKIRTLHLAWFAFFLTFMVWFNHAPLLTSIKQALTLTDAQVKALLILNVALTIPARIVIGMLVDKFGPRRTFSLLLASSSVLCMGVATADSFERLALFRFLLGFVGAGFVIGIRLVGEWFPAKQVGVAEGLYGGWGNFGSAASAMTLPTIALWFGGEDGWRYAMGVTGLMSLLYSAVFFWQARDTPKGSTYFKPKKSGGLEVTSKRDFYFLLLMNIPMYGALCVLAWKLTGLGLLSDGAAVGIYLGLAALYVFQSVQIFKVNREVFEREVPEMQRYPFKQVAVLDLAYFVSFGSELAVVSMLPLFFLETFEGLSEVTAAMLASGFAFMNLAARPGGGWMSDKFGRKKTLTILVAGLCVGYLAMSQVSSGWPIALAVVACMGCSFFVQSAEGAVFAMVPLVQRRMTGQIAGMAGAYGNTGAVCFLTVLSFVDYSTFFLVIAGAAAVTLVTLRFMDEPKGHMVEVADDGTVQLLEVA